MPAGASARSKARELDEQAARLHAEAVNWRAGAVGEERVAAALAGADREHLLTLHDRLLDPDRSQANLDHVVVCRGGVYLVDTKNWTGAVTAFGGSLWQHWRDATGKRSDNKLAELTKVRRMAEAASTRSGTPITPVLCLAGDRSARFGEAQVLQGVTVVPVGRLLTYLSSRPVISTSDTMWSQAVALAATFPAAVDADVAEPTPAPAPPPSPSRAPRAPRRRQRRTTAPRRRAGVRRAAVFAVLALLTVALVRAVPQVVTHVMRKVAAVPTTSTPSPAAAALTDAERSRLADWRIQAGLYRDNDAPPVLQYVPDSGLREYSHTCRSQRGTLARYRPALRNAPDGQLATWATRFDSAAEAQLTACIDNRPVALHHARDAMTYDADQVDVRYARLLGEDPRAYDTHVL